MRHRPYRATFIVSPGEPHVKRLTWLQKRVYSLKSNRVLRYSRPQEGHVRIFFATDIHGSEICWKKFLNAGKFYQADVLVLGGDMTGKALVPIHQQPDGTWKGVLLQQEFLLNTEDEVREFEKRVGSRGYYPFRASADML